MKKFSYGIALGLLISFIPATIAATTFFDVQLNSWYNDSVMKLSGLGIIQGYSDGSYKPDKNVNRAELAVIIDRLLTYVENEKQNKKSEITKIDEEWNEYINYEYDFSIKFPANIDHANGSCTWENESYRPETVALPVKIFEGNNDFFIANEFYFKLTKETIKGDVNYFEGCERVNNSYENLKNESERSYQNSWNLKMRLVKNDQELETFIHENYGQGCKIKGKTGTTQNGVYKVEILTDGKDLDMSTCVLNGAYSLFYNSNTNAAVTWGMGQSYSFSKQGIKYDEEMLTSFKFIDSK
ncbi:hypothetical protein A2483_00475 [Candidatus Peregrinibacteria bacterium RIFOXYC2_FULL_33_13]|nr:MAG: hypothetical protein UR27_C0008G0014 [Candidatus Peregrinibacteria bacterium GW2011_GWA2_33_10]KKP38989.1 MAG: hypothetical protein UR30_C0013G0013 [Candidatus Peregrinibacteria bacterium GW2011_GWC2_33_13]OGJ49988.1 MAG: hypothetical protein A2229_02915 [Candidatus Peregrinibacteria bacterium RIFOXYA2_FULL_33_7]OGJ53383.1 MAG: hypothetical protein A2483_00475 [Candidatus Peregrinibacteria bacterium RIFOXYC2_FULL_33_13]